MPFAKFFGRRRFEQPAHSLYVTLVEQSRRPEFYVQGGVPDSLDGRFDMLILHAYLVMRRLKKEGDADAGHLSQALFDLMFADMDQNLREMGVGDLSVGKKVKAMVEAFYGRAVAYDEGLDGTSDAVLGEALRRNLYGTAQPDGSQVAAMISYLRREDAVLAKQPLDGFLAGRVAFTAPGMD